MQSGRDQRHSGPGGLRLEPQGYATREQMAVMLAQFCRELNVWNEPMPEI